MKKVITERLTLVSDERWIWGPMMFGLAITDDFRLSTKEGKTVLTILSVWEAGWLRGKMARLMLGSFLEGDGQRMEVCERSGSFRVERTRRLIPDASMLEGRPVLTRKLVGRAPSKPLFGFGDEGFHGHRRVSDHPLLQNPHAVQHPCHE